MFLMMNTMKCTVLKCFLILIKFLVILLGEKINVAFWIVSIMSFMQWAIKLKFKKGCVRSSRHFSPLSFVWSNEMWYFCDACQNHITLVKFNYGNLLSSFRLELCFVNVTKKFILSRKELIAREMNAQHQEVIFFFLAEMNLHQVANPDGEVDLSTKIVLPSMFCY